MKMTRDNVQEEQTASTMMNRIVANQGVLFVKLHQYHWYVQGPHFFTLHEKFEELYDDTSERFDAFAERLIAKGEKPFSTLGEYLDYASISEKPYDVPISAEEMVRNLIDDYHTIETIVVEAIALAGAEDDSVSEDMLIEYKEHIDLTIWMLQDYLGYDARKADEK